MAIITKDRAASTERTRHLCSAPMQAHVSRLEARTRRSENLDRVGAWRSYQQTRGVNVCINASKHEIKKRLRFDTDWCSLPLPRSSVRGRD